MLPISSLILIFLEFRLEKVSKITQVRPLIQYWQDHHAPEHHVYMPFM